MKYDAQILSHTRLFSGIRENQIEELLLRLKAREIRYRKHGFLLMAGMLCRPWSLETVIAELYGHSG